MSAFASDDLREQAVAAFDRLRRADRIAAPASSLRRPLGTAPLTAETVLDRLLHVSWSLGVLAVHRHATADILLSLEPDSTLVVHDGALAVVAEALPRRRALRLWRADTGTAETVSVDDLLGPAGRASVLTVADAERSYLGADDHHDHHHHHSLKGTTAQLFRMLRPERRDLWTIIAYALAVGLTSLVLPLVSQALIDAISLGVYTSQVLVLGGVVAVGMLLNGGFGVVQHYAVDLLQRRIFVRTGLGIARRLPRIQHGAFNDTYAPELVNRFFDVVNLQKSLAKILMDGLAYALVAVASLALLAVYSPFFLALSVVAALFVPFVVFGLGRGGLGTSVDESHEKYALARWLEEVGRTQTSFKLYAPPPYVHARADTVAARYVDARGQHFRVILRQQVASLLFRTVVTLAALGIGGALVVDGQLSLGQFVAAELALLSLLSALDRLVNMLEHGFDLLTAVHKLSNVTDLPTDPAGIDALPAGDGPLAVSIRGVSFSYPGRPNAPLRGASLEVPAGARVNIVGENGSGRTTLSYLLAGVMRPSAGMIALGGHDLSRLDAHGLRGQVGLALGSDELFDGTLEENITMGRPLSFEQVWAAVQIAALDAPVLTLPDGLQTQIVGAGRSLSGGLARRIMIARAVASGPRLLVLDDAYEGLEPAVRARIARAIYADRRWTVIDTSDDPGVLGLADAVHVLTRDGVFAQAGTPAEARAPDSALAQLQPETAAALRAAPPIGGDGAA